MTSHQAVHPSTPIPRREAGVLLDARTLQDDHDPDGALTHLWLAQLEAAGFSAWQMLPPSIPDGTGSPYSSVSAFAADPQLVPGRWRERRPTPAQRLEYLEQEGDWIDNYALFQTLREAYGQRAWIDWPAALRDREPSALKQARNEHTARVTWHIDQQWAADQWRARLRHEANARGIALIGDLPIFVAHDSAEVWAHRELFLLDPDGRPGVVAGVPPDYFSATGQRWGNPHYHWDAMQADDFAWWRARLARAGRWFDRVRIDHFRGLEAVWMIAADAPTAIDGRWVPVPGRALLERVTREPGLPELLAEDLGVITPEVDRLRRDFHLPGMAVLQFSFDHFDDNPHKPHNITADRVVYTGTHDNDTTAGWFMALDSDTRARVVERLGLALDPARPPSLTDAAGAARALWHEGLATTGATMIVPLQDLLGLGSDARTNTPGTTEHNWRWRPAPEAIAGLDTATLRATLTEHGRLA